MYGLQTPIPFAVAPIAESGELVWKPFVTERIGSLAGHLVGDAWIAITDVGAPRGRLVSIALDNATLNDPSTWAELVGESDAVMRFLTPVGDELYVADLVDTYSQVRVFDRTGAARGLVPLPGRGSVAELPFAMMNLFPPGRPDEFLFSFSTFTASPGCFSHRPGATGVEMLSGPAVTLPGTVVEDGWATSADGTRIPYHLVRRRDVLLNRPRPALIYGYGGYNAAWLPAYPREMAAFVDSGGVYVHVHLRGGSEFGREWWEQGRRKNKTNGYADLYAIAEDLIATGVTGPDVLAVTGASNGGTLAGIAAVQRPDLFAVTVPRVPHLDLIGACGDGYGRYTVNLELADADDPDEVRRLAGFSPYHLVKEGIVYPAVFVDAGDTDPRCPPWHARKYAARMQAATSGDAPILVHVWRNVGHGWATDAETALTEHTEWLAFTMKILGMRPREV
ncbi:prolyl oligopeptidase family serine peptidase [Streptomyces odonnellii]|uniref:prolyl oligopeptidase family serine peptidase n=1 Tax=Streptomyces odonnellii TaxID=1417980 RepID=UPI000695B720|nr:prolyl oligopeptidase family serine peptidase [Streptomyces odonnellii]